MDVLGLYEIDVHEFLTYYLALKAGINKKKAERFGVVTQALDAPNDERDAMYDAGQIGGNTQNMIAYHFPSQERLAELRELAFKENANWIAIGEYFHALQDTYSHSKGEKDRDWNYHGDCSIKGGELGIDVTIGSRKVIEQSVKIENIEVFKNGGCLGHGRLGHKPDHTWEYSDKGMKMAKMVYEEMILIAKAKKQDIKPVAWEEIEETVKKFMEYNPKANNEVYTEWAMGFYPVDNVTYEGYSNKIKILDESFTLPEYSKIVQNANRDSPYKKGKKYVNDYYTKGKEKGVAAWNYIKKWKPF